MQAALKLVLEPIFEADFKPCSYGFRPKRRAQDAIAEIHNLGSPNRNYHWVFEGDITACFDEIDHTALMHRVRRRIGDKRVLRLVKAFLKAGVLSEEGLNRETTTGTPQGGILSPLLANIALSVLDEHFSRKWEALGSASTRARRHRAGHPVMKLVRYADDFVVMVHGTRDDTEALWAEVGSVLAPMGLRLSETKTRVCHIDEGFDFLGWRIQRRRRRGRTGKHAIYTYPSKKALASVVDKVRTLTRKNKHRTLADLLRRLNPALRGWCHYFRHGVSSRTFHYVDHFAFWRIVGWLHKRHVGLNMHTLVRRYLPGWRISDGGIEMFRPRHRQHRALPLPGRIHPDPLDEHDTQDHPHQRLEHMESRMRWKSHVRFGGRTGETHRSKDRQGAPVRPNIPIVLDGRGAVLDQGHGKRVATAEQRRRVTGDAPHLRPSRLHGPLR